MQRLRRDLEVEYAVIGGGITGLTAALHLIREVPGSPRTKVALIEQGRIGGGETGRTTAHITEVIDSRFHRLASQHGRETAQAAREASRLALDQIEAWVKQYGIDCAFERVPALLYAENQGQLRELEKEREGFIDAGLEATWVENPVLPGKLSALAALRVADQGQFRPLAYLEGLARAFIEAGGMLFEESHVESITEVGEEVGDAVELRCSGDLKIRAGRILSATDSPISHRFTLHSKLQNYRTYALAAKWSGEKTGLLWDLQEPYHYTRTQKTPEGTFLIVGGEDHLVGEEPHPEERFASLERYTREMFGRDLEITDRWSGQIVEPADGLPYIGIGPASRREFVATGFTGNGMTLGTFGGILASDLMLDREHRLSRFFEPDRVKLRASATNLIKENAHVALRLVRDRIGPAEAKSLDEVPRGEGRVVSVDGIKAAVYRDEMGAVKAVSSVCTHLGCQVHFNSAEKSWDCPCHGSRFGTDGHVMHGPALSPLEPVSIEDLKTKKGA